MSAKNCLRLSVFVILGIALACAQDKAVAGRTQHIGQVRDWTSRHVVLSGGVTAENVWIASKEPRLSQQLHLRALAERTIGSQAGFGPFKPPRPQQKIIDGSPGNGRNGVKVDWAVSLGNGHVAVNMFPAKFNFDINGTPSCTSDYVVFALNVRGVSNGQANMVGIRNLYSGNPTGLCGTAPTIDWAYNGSTATGSVLTSPVISLDGKKIAYVESAAGSAVFHILTWVTGQGTVNRAITPNMPGGTACTAATNCLESVTFSSAATDTFSSPWVDYATDKGFVASDDGKVYRISCVFKLRS